MADTHRSSGSALGLPNGLLNGLEGCDLILHAGDFNSMAVVDILTRIAPVFGVFGNNDEPAVQHAMPEKRYFSADKIKLGLVHGHQRASNARAAAIAVMRGNVDCVIYGHSHMQDWSSEEGLLLVNPGSPTQRRRSPQRSFAIMQIDVASSIHVEFVALT